MKSKTAKMLMRYRSGEYQKTIQAEAYLIEYLKEEMLDGQLWYCRATMCGVLIATETLYHYTSAEDAVKEFIRRRTEELKATRDFQIIEIESL
jgi:hypothetical protein